MFWYPTEADLEQKDDRGVTLRQFLAGYDPHKYELPAVTTDIALFRTSDGKPRLMMVRRGRHPSYGMLALPGGFLEMDEDLQDGAARELMEETGIQGIPLHQLGAYGTLGRDPRMRIITVAYIAVTDQQIQFQAGDDAQDADFFDIALEVTEHNDGTNFRLMVRNSKYSAEALIHQKGQKRQIVRSSIGSDHALIILDAIEELGWIDNYRI